MIADDDTSQPEDHRLSDVGDIIQRLHAAAINPVTRARIRVEQEIPPERRGPGWDRHWRELEAYADSPAEWQGGEPEETDETGEG